MTTAELIYETRYERRLSQSALAKKAGVSRETINRIERGHYEPLRATLLAIAVALDIRPSELRGKPNPNAKSKARA